MGSEDLSALASEGEAEIAGSPSALRELSAHLRAASGHESSIRVASRAANTLDRILIRRTAGFARVGVRDQALTIVGSASALDVLAQNIDFVAGQAHQGAHIHIEHYSDHPYLDPSSLPLVVCVEATDG